MKIIDVYRSEEIQMYCNHCGTPIKNCVDCVDNNGIKKTIGKTCFANLYMEGLRPETKTRFNRLFKRGKNNKRLLDKVNKAMST